MRHKRFVIILLLLCRGYLSPAQSAEALLQEGLAMEKQTDEAGALKKYAAVLKTDSLNARALNRSALLLVRKGRRQKSAKPSTAYYLSAKNYAAKATAAYPDNKESLFAMSLALQQLSVHAGAKEKASYLKDARTYLDKALHIDSAYAPAWHALGAWNMEIHKMNFVEKAATKLLFGNLPEAGVAAAINAYQKCRKLDPAFIENYYDLAGAYHAKGDDTHAIATLKQAVRLRPLLEDDRSIQEKCRKMLQSLQ